MKRQNGCGSDGLIKGIINKLEEKRKLFIKEEELTKQKRMQLEGMMKPLLKKSASALITPDKLKQGFIVAVFAT